MRAYLQVENLRRAAALAAVVTVLSVPRLALGPAPLLIYVPSAFLAMTLVGGAVTAWSREGGMHGIWAGRAKTRYGLIVAVTAGIVMALALGIWLDPALRTALEKSGDLSRLDLHFPPALSGRIAAVLWMSSFQVLFFYAGAMSFLARLTRRWTVATVLIVIFRLLVVRFQLALLPIDNVTTFHVVTAGTTAFACVLFARTGLIPTVVFTAVSTGRVLFD